MDTEPHSGPPDPNIDLLKANGAKKVYILKFPFMQLAIHEVTDTTRIITINEMVFVHIGKESEAKATAMQLLFQAHMKLSESLAKFLESETEIVDKYNGINEKPFLMGEDNEAPKIP